MRNLLITLKLLIFMIVIGQDPIPSSSKLGIDTVKQTEIEKSIKVNEEKIEEVKLLKLKNDAELEKIKGLELQKKAINKSNIKLLDKLLRTKNNPRIVYIQKTDKFNPKDIKIDSICVSTTRDNVFSRKKCNKWEYFKYIDDPTQGRITVK